MAGDMAILDSQLAQLLIHFVEDNWESSPIMLPIKSYIDFKNIFQWNNS
jgi:hypothetical protein